MSLQKLLQGLLDAFPTKQIDVSIVDENDITIKIEDAILITLDDEPMVKFKKDVWLDVNQLQVLAHITPNMLATDDE